MIRGKLALGGLSIEFGAAQKRFDEISRRVRELTKQYDDLVERERQVVEDLARLYLPELSPEAVSAGLRALQGDLGRALREKDEHHVSVLAELTATEARIREKERAVEEAEAEEQRAAAPLDDARHAAESALAADREHAEQVAEHRAILERRAVLRTRRARLMTTGNVERFRYEQSKAFSYLLGRGYREPGYRGRLLGRWMDGWLARRIGFETLYRNYRILRTGPHAIQAEMRRLTERAQELEAAIDAREEAVGAEHGLLPALEAEATAQRRLNDARDALHLETERRDRLAAELREIEVDRGGPYEDALDMHRDFLHEATIRELTAVARSTPDAKDDRLVDRLDALRDRIHATGRELEAQRKELQRLADRTGSIAELARNALRDFSSRRVYFPEEEDVREAVRAVVGGEAPDDARGRLARAHVRQRVLQASAAAPQLDGWFAELSSLFDPELHAATIEVADDADVESEVIVHDSDGRILHRRVTRRRGRPPSEG